MKEMKEEKDLITFITNNGDEIEAEVLMFFSYDENPERKYIVYTFNEKDKNGMYIVHSGIYQEGEGNRVDILNIEDEAEWNRVKETMRDAVKEGRTVVDE